MSWYSRRVMPRASWLAPSPCRSCPLRGCLLLYLFLLQPCAAQALRGDQRAAGPRGPQAHARAYLLEDQSLLVALGVSSGYLSVVVLALYTSALTAGQLYRYPVMIWMTCTLLLYWISHVWLVAHRGGMQDDPLRFLLQDRLSWILVPLMGFTAWLAL